MNGKQIKKLIWETNTPPPTNYIWVKPNGKPYEFNNSTKKWEESNCFGGISENMSEEEQMEIRKNLGLYYEETSVVEKSVTYNTGSTHLSDDVPTKDNIVKVLFGDKEMDISIHDITNGYAIRTDGEDMFYVTQDGIRASYVAVGLTLFYKISETTVSKINTKFLPEQEGAILLQVPTESVSNAVRSDYISDEDWKRLVNGKVCVAKYYNPLTTGYRYFLITGITNTVGTISTATMVFNGTDTVFAIQQLGNACQITIGAINGVYNISALPSNGMSSTELEAIGFKNQDLSKFGDEVKQIRCTNGNGTEIATIISVYSFSMTYNVEFWTKDNKYVLSGSLMGSDLSCTVTPR